MTRTAAALRPGAAERQEGRMRDPHSGDPHIAATCPPVLPVATEEEWSRWEGILTWGEYRHLVFLRWLYRKGRLTEYPDGHSSPAGAAKVTAPAHRVW